MSITEHTGIIRGTKVNSATQVSRSGIVRTAGGGGGGGSIPAAVNDIFLTKDGMVYRYSLENMWKERTGRTTQAVNGDVVGEVADLQTNQTAKPLQAPTDARRPDADQVGVGNIQGILGTGTDVIGYNTALSVDTPFTVVSLVYTNTFNSANPSWVDVSLESGGSSKYQWGFNTAPSPEKWFHWAGTVQNSTSNAQNDTFLRVHSVPHTSGATLDIQEVAENTGSTGSRTALDTVAILNTEIGGNPSISTHLADVIVFGTLTAGELTAIYDWFDDIEAGLA